MGRALSIIASVVGAVGYLYFVARAGRDSVYLPIQRRLRGHAASGDVVKVVPHDHAGDATEYALTVDFTTPTGTRYPGAQLAQNVTRRYAVGDRIGVVFDPDNPQDARAWSWTTAIRFTVAVAPVCVALGVFLIITAAGWLFPPYE